MRLRAMLAATGMGIGSAIIALPDTGPRLFSLSSLHGPSAVDALGILVLLAGYALLLGGVLRRRARVAAFLARRPAWLMGLTYLFGLGTGLLLAGVFADFWWWWLIGALMLTLFSFALLAIAGRDG